MTVFTEPTAPLASVAYERAGGYYMREKNKGKKKTDQGRRRKEQNGEQKRETAGRGLGGRCAGQEQQRRRTRLSALRS